MTAPIEVLDVTDSTFASEVIERSSTMPVVVDFWAPWCGPCRVLGPIIERIAAEHAGEVALVKLNTDENPRTASQYRIQGIPAVKAFMGGKVATEFTGAIPEPQVRAFFQRIVPSPAEKAVREAQQLIETNPAEAERRFEEILHATPDNTDALIGLAEALLQRGAHTEAAPLLERAPGDRRVKVLKHRVFLQAFAEKHAAEDIEGEAQRSPDDPRSRYRWGVLLAARGDYEAALEQLLESIRLDRSFADGAARQAMLAIFELLGVTPLTRAYQQQLSMLLF